MKRFLTTILCLSTFIFSYSQLASWSATCNGSPGNAASPTVSPYTMGISASCQTSCFSGKGNLINYDPGGFDRYFFGYVATENTSISELNYDINRQGTTFNEWNLQIQVGSSLIVNKFISSSHSGNMSFSESLNQFVNAGETVSIFIYPQNYQGTPGCFGNVFFSLESASISGSLLPVELVDFTAEVNKNIVDLNWSTASELNNDYFEILKSTNGQDFYTVGEVQGNGTTKEFSYYSFSLNQEEEISYYKLKQNDYDGKFEYSPVVVAKRYSAENNISDLRINANKEIEWSSALSGSVQIVNAMGQILDTYAWDQENSSHQLQLNNTSGSSGILFLKFSDNTVEKLYVY